MFAIGPAVRTTHGRTVTYAKEFDISPRLFQRRLHGYNKRKVVNMRLSAILELVRKEYIEFLDDIELSMKLLLIRGAANYLWQL